MIDSEDGTSCDRPRVWKGTHVENTEELNLETICFQLITSSGAAKSAYMEAIQEAKAGDFKKAHALVEQGDKIAVAAHSPHLKLIQKEAAGHGETMTLLLTHSEDQMMSTEMFKVLAEEIIGLYEKIAKDENHA